MPRGVYTRRKGKRIKGVGKAEKKLSDAKFVLTRVDGIMDRLKKVYIRAAANIAENGSAGAALEKLTELSADVQAVAKSVGRKADVLITLCMRIGKAGESADGGGVENDE